MQTAIARAADLLLAAERAAVPCGGIADLIDRSSTAEGYAVQLRANGRRRSEGRAVAGYKIGLTAPAAQAAFGAREPMRGLLFADTRLKADTAVPLDRLCAPRLEGEIVLKVAASPDVGMDEPALAATVATAHAALEIADSRVGEWRVGIGEAIADNACCGRFGLVEPGRSLDDIDLTALRMTIHEEGVDVPLSEGLGANCLGSPLAAYRWLIEALAAEGTALQPCDLVLTGALGPVVPMRPGMRYLVTIERLGTLRLAT